MDKKERFCEAKITFDLIRKLRIGSIISTDGKRVERSFRHVDHGIESEETDFYRLWALNQSGKIIATMLLDIYTDQIRCMKVEYILSTIMSS